MNAVKKTPFSAIRRRAGELLSQNGNRLLLIKALMISLVFVSMYGMLFSAVSAVCLLYPTNLPFTLVAVSIGCLLAVLLSVFFTCPLLLGNFWIACRVATRECAVLADLFWAFSSGRAYARALRLSWSTFWRGALIYLFIGGTVYVFSTFLPPFLPFQILCGVLVAAEAFWGLLLYSHAFFTLYVGMRAPDLPWWEVKRCVQQNYPTGFGRGLRFFFCYLPQMLLGALTFGLLLLADGFPKMLVAYFLDCADAEAPTESCKP